MEKPKVSVVYSVTETTLKSGKVKAMVTTVVYEGNKKVVKRQAAIE